MTPAVDYIEVAVALPVFQTFTYGVPEIICDFIAIGKRVLVVSEMKSDPLSGILSCSPTADAPARRCCSGTARGRASIRSDSSVDVSHCSGVEVTKKCSR